jgi:cell division protein YceG involved in septum cleavage
VKGNSDVVIKIKNTDNWEQVEQQLLENKEIKYPRLLIFITKTLNHQKNIRSGRYAITRQIFDFRCCSKIEEWSTRCSEFLSSIILLFQNN